MKKGFTLIELLAVIAVLAVIILIASNIVLNVLENSKIEAYKNNEKMFVKAAETYLANNQLMLPALNSKTEISLDTLKTNKFITAIKDPKDNSDCTGYIVVSNIEGSFVYTPHLRCDTTANNSSEDNLVLQYTFDEEKESTENLITYDSSFDTYTIGDQVSYVTQLGTGSYQGVSNEVSLSGDKSFKIIKGSGNRTYRTLNLFLGDTVTISMDIYSNTPGSNFRYELFGGDYSWTGAVSPNHSGNGWERLTLTVPPVTSSTVLYYFIYPIDTNPIYIDNIQIEKKSYATPYVNGTRLDVIKDLSSNSNNSTLTVANTPKWTNKMYQFNGINNYLSITQNSSLNLGTSGTISLFAKCLDEYPSIDTNMVYEGLISKTMDGAVGHQSYYIDWYGTNSTRALRVAIGDATGENEIVVTNFDFNNEFYHISYKWDATNLTLFINGKKISSIPKTKNPQILANNLEIGRAFNANNAFKGFIDDVRIYNRALSDNEIEAIYYTNITKY